MKVMLKTSAYPSLLCSKTEEYNGVDTEKIRRYFLNSQKRHKKIVASIGQAYQAVLVEKYGQGKILKVLRSACRW